MDNFSLKYRGVGLLQAWAVIHFVEMNFTAQGCRSFAKGTNVGDRLFCQYACAVSVGLMQKTRHVGNQIYLK